MKKTLLILIGLSLVISCKSKKKTVSTAKYPTTKRVIKDRAKTDGVKGTDAKRTVVVPKLGTEKTIFTTKVLDDLYARKPKLRKVKIDYIKKYSVLAIQEMETYKIPASITLAQGLLESRYGLSLLTKKSKNHFGIKCHVWKGQRVYHDDDAKGECFRKYSYDKDSYRDHSLFLANKKRYAKLFTYAPNDYKSWAKGLRKAGYATDKKYPQKLINLIEEYELYVFDNFVLGEDYESKRIKKETKTADVTKTHIVDVGETLYSISGIYYVSVSELKKINQLKSDTIAIGQVLKLIAPKNYKTKKIILKTHKVQAGDTIYSISQKYNLTANKLKTLNELESNVISIDQELIVE